MARRVSYVSFFSEGRSRRRDFAGFESRVGPSRLVLPLLIVAYLTVSVWWFAFRHVDEALGGVLTLEDTNIPTVLLPSGAATDDASLLLSGISIDCATEITEWPMFQGGITREGCVQAPTVTTPKILWRTEVGITGWLNSPIVANNTVYVATAGVAQGQQDRRDGVYALNLFTGKQEWFFGATLDVNGIAYGNGVVVATGDEGQVWGIGARDGSLVWAEDLGVSTFGNPLIVGDIVVIGDADGVVTAFDVRTGRRRWQRQVDGPVRGGASSDGEIIVIAGEERDVLAVDLAGNEKWRVELQERGPSGDLARIWNAPTFADDLVVFTLLREDTFAEPAIAALNKNSGELVWRSIDVAGIKNDWGNIRSSMARVGDLLVYGEPYSDRIVAIETETGETAWSVPAGSYCFPHWPSAAVVSGQIIMPRHDGGLYAVSVEDEDVAWSIYLGNLANSTAGNFPPSMADADFCEWSPKVGHSVLSSPAIAPNGFIIIGTLEGYIVAVGDRTW